MKKLIGVVIVFCFVSLSAFAQSTKPTKIYFFNGVATLGTTDLKLMADGKKVIIVRRRTWIVVETTSDSLGLFLDDKPYFVHIEPGKSYYFTAQSSYQSFPTVTEKSELEFMMILNINSAKGPEEYKLGKLAN